MFFNDLKDEMEPEETYLKAKKLWDHFNIQNHKEFISLYLKSDVMLLADCFEKFRDFIMNNYMLDPCHCYSVPGLTWQAGLKFTNIKLDLLSNIDDILFFEKCIRGGISGVMGSRYFKTDENYKLLYIDANNLYGWAMMEYLPYKDFKSYIPEKELTKEEILAIPDDSGIGFFLEVDLDYPENIKFKSKNLPYCPEKIFIEEEDLSPYQINLLKSETSTNKRPRVNKLILSQTDKKNYIVHYRMLKFYLQQGMILKKVHRIISFTQSKWLRPYIDFNTKQRMIAKTDFEKDFFKLMNNSYYGKTCENIRNRQEVKLVTDPEKVIKLHNKPNFSNEKVFDNNLTAILLRKTSMKFDKPIYIGATVLSKLLMYKFYYETLQPYFGEKNMELLYLDTDSFVLKLKTNDLIKDLDNLKEHFDFSNYKKDHPLYDISKKKIPGYFKDELAGEEMTEFLALRSKAYVYKTKQAGIRTKETESKRLKGINRNVVKNYITFDDYKDTLFNNNNYEHKMRTLKSDRHEMYLNEITKASLSSFDDKRYILNDGIKTVPFGWFTELEEVICN
jgi:hypothetical protein